MLFCQMEVISLMPYTDHKVFPLSTYSLNVFTLLASELEYWMILKQIYDFVLLLKQIFIRMPFLLEVYELSKAQFPLTVADIFLYYILIPCKRKK